MSSTPIRHTGEEDLLIGTYNYLDLAPLGRNEVKGHGMD